MVAQVMTTSATSIKEQLTQMNEAIAKLTRTLNENDMQITMLMSRLELQTLTQRRISMTRNLARRRCVVSTTLGGNKTQSPKPC